jgi:5-formyltetrahydrofolate cyclo-ligase
MRLQPGGTLGAGMNETRRQLRRNVRLLRRGIEPQLRIAAAESLSAKLLALPFATSQGHVAGYWANDGEIALQAWQLR